MAVKKNIWVMKSRREKQIASAGEINAYKCLVRKPEWTRQLKRSSRSQEGNIKLIL
jgi:hypothetical protein